MSNLLDNYTYVLNDLKLLLEDKIEYTKFFLKDEIENDQILMNYNFSLERCKKDFLELGTYKSFFLRIEDLYTMSSTNFKSTLSYIVKKHKGNLKSAQKLLIEKQELHRDLINQPNIEGNQIDLIRELHSLEQRALDYENDLSSIDEIIEIIDGIHNELISGSYISVIAGYNKSWRWSEKLVHILSKEAKLLSLNQILFHVLEYEPNLKSESGDTRLLKKSISGILKYYCDDGTIKRTHMLDNDIYLYGLPDWFDKNDNILIKFK